MSTKTSIKRIALVAVAALGFGMVSTVSANAAGEELAAGGSVTAITASSVTTSPITSSPVYVKFGASLAALTAAAGDASDYITFKAALTSVPTGGSVAVTSVIAGDASPTGTATPVVATGTSTTIALTASSSLPQFTVVVPNQADTAWSAQTLSYLGAFKFTPTKTGSYVMTIWNDGDRDGSIDQTEVYQTASITVGSPAGLSTGYSTVYALDGNGNAAAANSTTDATPIAASKTAATANAGAITVSIKDTSNVAITSGNTLTASISGPGYLKWSTADTTTADSCSATPTYSATLGRTISAQSADAVGTLYVCADGTAGTSTITLTATDAAGTSYALGTKTATFFGSVATLTATAVSKYIADSLNATDANTDTGGVVAAITAADSNGNNVELAAGDFTAVTAATLLAQGLDAVTFAAGDGAPYSASKIYVVINPTAGKTGAKSLTLTHTSSEKTVDVAFTVSAISAATVTATLDKTEYLPGEKATVTITSKDASGLFSPDATTATDLASSLSITTNKSVQGTLPTAASFTNGVQTFSFYVPATTGTLNMNVKLASGSAWATALDDTTIALTANVVSDSTTASDAVDAANEATDAANAATDAANAAAEAADAATAAAQDAQAAVAALATQVASLIAGIKAQITTLTNLVIKIQKKVRA